MQLNDRFTCTSCGKDDKCNTSLESDEGKLMVLDTLCFYCAFWTHKIENPHPQRAIIEGTHYVVYPGTSHRGMLGFGGSRTKVRYFDGYDVESNNMWCQGDIPEIFRDRLPDNASFVKGP